MADNVTTQSSTLATIPASTKISTDEDATNGHVQRVKLAYSADGVSTHATVDADGVLVNLGTNNDVTVATLPLPSGAATSAEQATQTASLSVIDDWDESDRAKVNPIVGQAGVAAGAGAVAATVQRVTLASDDPAVTALQILDNAVSGSEIQVDVVAALPAGDNNIGNVDVATVPAPLNVTGGGTEAAALRVTIASDSTGVVEVVGDAAHDAATAGNPLLVGGYASAAAPSDVSGDGDAVRQWMLRNGSAATTLTAAGALIGGDAANGLDVDVTRVSGTVTIAGAVTNAGTFVTQENGAALTSLQLMDDVVFVDDAAFTPGTSKAMAQAVLAVAHGSAPDAADALDAVIPLANRHRVQWTIGGHPNAKSATYITTSAGTDDNVLAAIAGGTKYAITRITAFLDEACTVGVAVRLGFGTANVPALGASQADGVDDILCYHPGLVPGSGFTIGDGSAVLGCGADGAELRITNEVPTGGTLSVTVTYFPIES